MGNCELIIGYHRHNQRHCKMGHKACGEKKNTNLIYDE